MKENQLDFLQEYKKICIKYKMQILGFDDGAYISELTDAEYELECLAYEPINYDDGSKGMRNLSFRDMRDFKNSIQEVRSLIKSTATLKEWSDGKIEQL